MKRISFLLLALSGFAGSGVAFGQTGSQPSLVPFHQFLQEVRIARAESFGPAQGAKVQGETDFGKMRQHLLSLYEGVEVGHSFLLDGQVFDCVPVEQQPSVRQLGLAEVELEAPPPALADKDLPGPAVKRAASPLTLGLRDALGNAVSCAQGTIPFRRVTLQEMTRFRTLEGFFHKLPDGLSDDLAAKDTTYTHKYAHAYQTVKNFGGNSWLSLWSPSVDVSAQEIFSLAQHWYIGGSGKKTQTVEGGWQVYPQKYGTDKAAFFIYWTADDYNKTGCYNLDCAGFVQTNPSWALGGIWDHYSTPGGPTYAFQMQWKLVKGRWWLYGQVGDQYEAVGYYPVSIYRGGRLSKFADRIDYGGETVGATRWPPMGSGAYDSAGSSQTAYQSRIFYFKNATASGAVWSSLTTSQTSPSCYRLSFVPVSVAGTDIGSYFYFGGPGGDDC